MKQNKTRERKTFVVTNKKLQAFKTKTSTKLRQFNCEKTRIRKYLIKSNIKKLLKN
jgi:hypothetical protein